MNGETRKNDGSPNPSPASMGNGETAGTVSEHADIRICPHRFCGCISNVGYVCLHVGPCEPLDEHGNLFTVSYIVEDGQRLMVRTPQKPVPGKTLIDADTAAAAAGIRGRAATLDATLFRDREPFDVERFISDVIGS